MGSARPDRRSARTVLTGLPRITLVRFDSGLNPVQPHQSGDPIFSAAMRRVFELLRDARTAVNKPLLLIDLSDAAQQALILLFPLTLAPASPPVIACAGHYHGTT